MTVFLVILPFDARLKVQFPTARIGFSSQEELPLKMLPPRDYDKRELSTECVYFLKVLLNIPLFTTFNNAILNICRLNIVLYIGYFKPLKIGKKWLIDAIYPKLLTNGADLVHFLWHCPKLVQF